jgi:chromosome segregation ATPase
MLLIVFLTLAMLLLIGMHSLIASDLSQYRERLQQYGVAQDKFIKDQCGKLQKLIADLQNETRDICQQSPIPPTDDALNLFTELQHLLDSELPAIQDIKTQLEGSISELHTANTGLQIQNTELHTANTELTQVQQQQAEQLQQLHAQLQAAQTELRHWREYVRTTVMQAQQPLLALRHQVPATVRSLLEHTREFMQQQQASMVELVANILQQQQRLEEQHNQQRQQWQHQLAETQENHAAQQQAWQAQLTEAQAQQQEVQQQLQNEQQARQQLQIRHEELIATNNRLMIREIVCDIVNATIARLTITPE